MGEIVLDILKFLFEDALTKMVSPVLNLMEIVALSPDTIEKMPYIDLLYVSMQGIGLGVLILVSSFQAFKGMMIGLGFEAEEPQKIAVKTFVAGFLIFYIKDIMMKIIESSSTMIYWITDSLLSDGFEGSGLFQMLTTALSTGGLMLILALVLIFNCCILFWKMFLRLCMCGLLLICSPLAVASMVSKATEGFWQGFMKLFVGNIAIQVIQSACVAAIIVTLASMTPALSQNIEDKPELFFSMMLLIALVSLTNKLEDIIRDISMSVGIGRDMQGALGKIQSAAYAASNMSRVVIKFAGR
ncbi:MAG TPA: hypothetical protein VEA58_11120 [Anaerovoracaceae bacterium]|nr:hypothetical protein [Anaerovoracaceae bacterium]